VLRVAESSRRCEKLFAHRKALPGEVAFRYVFHCHILEHEDNDMMRPCDVVG
jgi:spore coat protein A, manganese oxidase